MYELEEWPFLSARHDLHARGSRIFLAQELCTFPRVTWVWVQTALTMLIGQHPQALPVRQIPNPGYSSLGSLLSRCPQD